MNDSAITWWRRAVVYQIYVRSFADTDGDGIGDLPGVTDRLPYLRDLGVDAVWLTPFYPSPQRDHGYDVSDFCDVDPLFGTLDDFDAMLAASHDLGLRVIVDLVPNHTSSDHPWFREAIAAEPGSVERARFHFRAGRFEGEKPPNNWRSVFGGPAWTRVGATDQWYLHLFDPSQPDLNWEHPDVVAHFDEVLRFWLDRGVDGFRVDVAHGLIKHEQLRDQVVTAQERVAIADAEMLDVPIADEPMWNQPGVHEIYRRWRRILDEYDGEQMAVAEAWTRSQEATAAYVRDDELHQAFNFHWLEAAWSADELGRLITNTLTALGKVGGEPTWVLSNHDVPRHPTRYGGGPEGLARARAATLVSLALPGSAYLYQGEELGLEDVDVAPDHRQDPSWLRTGKPGRDGCRVPMPWSGDRPPYGFGPGAAQPWIPQPDDWAAVTVAAQQADPDSTLAFYRRALEARRKHAVEAGGHVDVEVVGDVLTLRRGTLVVRLNCGVFPAPLPKGELVIASGPVDEGLPANTAVWVQSLSEEL